MPEIKIENVEERVDGYFAIAPKVGLRAGVYPEMLRLKMGRGGMVFYRICTFDGGAFYREMMGTPLTVFAF